jgi:UDP-N-acetylmuramate dehydrogenase
MQIDAGVSLKTYNTFGLPAVAHTLVRISSDADVRRVVDDPVLGRAPKFILGGGSNIILTRDMPQVVLKIEVKGMRIVEERADAWIVEAGAGERWDELVEFTLEQGCPGLENMALIPGTVGAGPVQNIGAYGVELKDRFESLDAVDLVTGRNVVLGPGICAFAYRDSVFRQPGGGGWHPGQGDGASVKATAPKQHHDARHSLAGRSVITRVRLRLPRPWQPVLGYLELQKKMAETGIDAPDARRVFDWVCAIRRAKLPDPAVIGNAGSFFKNPVVTPEQCRDIIGRDPEIVHYPMPDGSVKLAAAWMIDACGWKGKSVGGAGVYEKQALVLVNRGAAIGSEVMTLARAIQESVYGRFGIRLETEPVVV